MAIVKNSETKRPLNAPGFLRSFRNFFLISFTRIKDFFNYKSISPAATEDIVITSMPYKEDQIKTSFENHYFLLLPPDIRDKFFRLANLKQQPGLPLMNHAGNHSIVALLIINNMYFWGFANVPAALTPRNLHDLKAILKYERNVSPYSDILVQAEANAIINAFKQNINADCAIMFIGRKLCDICGSREFNESHLRRLFPLLSLKQLTVYTTNAMGQITQLVLSPLLIRYR